MSKSVQRNEHLAKIFNVLGLMEKEGSGYDIIFERLLFAAKPVPEVEEDEDSVCVKIQKNYIQKDLVQFMEKISMYYNLTQKEKICIGIIVQNGEINALELTEKLSAKNEDGLRSWTKGLIDKGLVSISGRTRGTVYSVTKETFENVKFQTKTTLKAIEPYRIKELIYEDLKRYKTTTFDEIHARIGREISHKEIRRQLSILIKEGKVYKIGDKKGTKYEFNKQNFIYPNCEK